MKSDKNSLELPLLRQPRHVALLAATFLFITVPYAALVLSGATPALLDAIGWFYWGTLGLSHFFITLVLYFQVRNLRYFSSSAENKVIYFLIPGAFFLYTGVSFTFGFWGNATAIGVVAAVGAIIRCFDFNHFAGQSFGVLQISKSHSGVVFDASQRTCERLFFLGVGVLQGLNTFLTGNRLDLSNGTVLAVAIFSAACFLGAAIPILSVLTRKDSPRAAWVPFGYFLAQATATAAAAYDMRLYGPALAVHYVEYHLLISQRVAHARLDEKSWPDRTLMFFQRQPWMLVGAFMVFSTFMYAVYTRKAGLGPLFDQSPTALQFTYNMSNGIFFMHYFVESFIWKFQNPFYREDMQFLAPRKAKAKPATAAAPRKRAA